MNFADNRAVPTDPKEIGKQFLEILDQVRAGARLIIKNQEPSNNLPAAGQEGLFLVLDHEGILLAAVRDEREFERVRVQRTIEILAREIPGTMPPEHQLALAGRRMSEIMPRFQMIRP